MCVYWRLVIILLKLLVRDRHTHRSKTPLAVTHTSGMWRLSLQQRRSINLLACDGGGGNFRRTEERKKGEHTHEAVEECVQSVQQQILS